MKLKTYQAYTMAEALSAVKRDLGDGAVILNTRSFQRGGFFGLGRKTVVQVTAGVPVPATDGSPSRSTKTSTSANARQDGRASTAQRAYRSAVTLRTTEQSAPTPVSSASPAASAGDVVTADDQRRTRRLAQAMMAKLERSGETGPTSSSSESAEPVPPRVAQPMQPAAPAPVSAGRPSRDHAAAPGSAPSSPRSSERRSSKPETTPRVAQRFVLAPPRSAVAGTPDDGQKDSSAPQSKTKLQTPSKPAASQQVSAASAAVQDELAAIKQMVSQVLHRQVSPSRADATASGGSAAEAGMPARLFDFYLKLISQDVSEELADEIVGEVRSELAPDELEQESAVRTAVLRHLANLIPVADAPLSPNSPDDRPLTIALIGPTGVGKTTTLAKLAASFKLRHSRRVGLITSDTYRIAAVDQLRTYANIIGLPLQVVLTPAEMRQAVHALRDCDVILIDTAGRGQNDTGRLEELSQFLAAGDPHEVHLVLSSTASEKVLLREAEAFSRVGVHKIMLTKLDEAVSFGMVINVIRSIGKQLSFVTTGQEVPDHIEVGRADRLAELILGMGEIRPESNRDAGDETAHANDSVGESWGQETDATAEEDARPEACAT